MGNLILIFLSFYFLNAQTNIIELSDNVGAIIDEHENRYYGLFPDEERFINAQVYQIDSIEFKIIITKEFEGLNKNVYRYVNKDELKFLSEKIKRLPPYNLKEKENMYDNLHSNKKIVKEIIILSDKVGSLIDIHENRFYKIFPNEKGFVSAQIYSSEDDKFKILIEKKIGSGSSKNIVKYISESKLNELKTIINLQPLLTDKDKTAMYKGMDFLRAEKILLEIPKPQYVVINYSDDKKVKGTFLKMENNVLFIQTPSAVQELKLESLDRLRYRTSIIKKSKTFNYVAYATTITGVLISNVFNSMRPATFTDYGLERGDIKVYRQILGGIIGLIFSGEVFDALSTLSTPMDTIILSEAEYDKEYQ